MPRYYFDVEDGVSSKDDVGTECANLGDVHVVASKFLPDVAQDEVPRDGMRHVLTLTARDEGGRRVYTATLVYIAHWLVDGADDASSA